MNKMYYTTIILLVFSGFFRLSCQTLIMNEVSNGPAGNQEYVEFVVVSNTVTYNCNNTTPPCIDIRGWIFDDNSGYHGSSGVASGAVRFSQSSVWACVPLGTIILIYNGADRNPAIPPDDISMSDGNCRIIAPISNATLFESNSTTPGASACSYPATGWTSGGNWNNTLFANPGDCARLVNLSGCEVFSVCWGSDNQNNLIYFSGAGGQKVWYFNNGNPSLQSNWSSGSASPSPGNQTPGAPNNTANASYISQFNNNCMPITPLQVTANSVSAGCTCNGSATASASGSIGGYTYAWYNSTFNPIGQTSATANGLCAGVYYVIGTSHIGCTDTAMVTITSSSAASVSVTSQNICAGQTTTLTANPATGGGTYLWTPGGQTTQSISVNPAGTTHYTVTYTMGACSGTSTAAVNVTPPPNITANSASICAGQTATLTANGATSYTWSTGSTTNPLLISPTITTTYTVTGATAGCSNTQTVTVTINPSPTVSVNSAGICAGETTTLIASGASSYSWSTGTASHSVAVAPATTTNYTVTGTNAGCTGTAIATVSVNPLPLITVNTVSICAAQTTTLTAGGATTYTWNNGSTTNTLAVAPASTTNYTVTGTSAGCTGSVIATVSVTPLPTVTVNSASICAGQTVTLTANGATSYSWNTGSITNPLLVSPTNTTIYTVTGTTTGCSTTTTASVIVSASPTVTVNSATICTGETTTLTATGAANYTWNTGSAANPLIVSPAITTNYTVTGTTAGCTGFAIATVSVNPLPVITVNSVSICTGQTTTLTANGATTYTWDNGATGSTQTIIPSSNTNYTVSGALNNCINTTTTSVTVSPVPLVTVNSATICSGQSTILTAAGATSYLWDNGQSTASISVNPMATTIYTVTGTNAGCSNTANAIIIVTPSPTLTVNSVGICAGQTATLIANGATTYQWDSGELTYSITASPATTRIYTVTGTTQNCSVSTTALITVQALPLVTVANQTICSGQTATLTATGATTYNWSNGSLLNPTVVNPTTLTTYTVTGNTAGCSGTATVSVMVETSPTVLFSPDVTSGCAPLCVQLTDQSTIQNSTIQSWLWEFENGNTSTVQHPVFCFTNPDKYDVRLTVTSVNGCSNSLTLADLIHVFKFPEANFTSDAQGSVSMEPIVQFSNLSSNATTYQWYFGDSYVSSETHPTHIYKEEGTYTTTLIATSNEGCKDTIIQPITVKGIFTFYAPNAFTPNNDEINDVFLPIGTNWSEDDYSLLIFDRWGRQCFSSNETKTGWDGKAHHGSEAAQIGSYTWKVEVKDISGEKHHYMGLVNLIR